MTQPPTSIIVPEDPGPDAIEAPVLKVLDGDGFVARIKVRDLTDDWQGRSEVEVTVRCGFIDAPEMDQPGEPEAKAFLSSLIARRQVGLVVLTKESTNSSFDRFGRLVCVPYLVEEYPGAAFRTASGDFQKAETFGAPLRVARNVELEMVLNGWAWVIERYGPDERYLAALEEARRYRRGIWVRDDNIDPWEFKRRSYRERALKPVPPPLVERERCPRDGCDGHLVRRAGRFGAFLGCANYPRCAHTQPATP